MIRTRRFGVWLGTISLLVPFLGSCRRAETSGPAASKTTTLLLAAYTTPREAYRDALLPGFEAAWKQKTGGTVEFRTSYQGSGAQARAIIGGFEADIAALALAPDIDKIVTEKLITQDWKARAHGGMVSNSVVVIAVRKGNPKGIKDWADLTRSGLNVLTPDPKTSGGAMWNINAIYGAALRGHAGVPGQRPGRGGRIPRERFQERLDHGQGSARVDHHLREGRRRRRDHVRERGPDGAGRRRALEYIVPKSTILIQNPAAVVDAYVDKHGTRDAAAAFLDYLVTPDAQRAFAKFGFRPVDPDVAKEAEAKFPKVEDLWTIDDLGGWPKVLEDVYGPKGVWTKVFAEKSASK